MSKQADKMERQAAGLRRHSEDMARHYGPESDAAAAPARLADDLEARAASIRAGKGDPRYPNQQPQEVAA